MSRSVVSDSLRPHGLTIHFVEFSRPEYWSGWPFGPKGWMGLMMIIILRVNTYWAFTLDQTQFFQGFYLCCLI